MFFHEYLGIYLIFNTHKRKFLLLLLTQEAKSRLAIFLNYIHQNPRVAPHLNIGFGQHCLHSAHSLFSLAYLSVWAARFNSPFPAHFPGGMSVHLTFCVWKIFQHQPTEQPTDWTDWPDRMDWLAVAVPRELRMRIRPGGILWSVRPGHMEFRTFVAFYLACAFVHFTALVLAVPTFANKFNEWATVSKEAKLKSTKSLIAFPSHSFSILRRIRHCW